MKNILRHAPVLLVLLLLGVFLLVLRQNLSDRFETVEKNYKDHVAVNLQKGMDVNALSEQLYLQNYIESDSAARFIASQISARLEAGKELPSLYALNTRDWRVSPALAAQLGGPEFRKRVGNLSEAQGLDSLSRSLLAENLPSTCTVDSKQKGEITVVVTETDSTAGAFKKMLWKDKKPCSGVLVNLREHYYVDSSSVAADSLICFLKTDNTGKAVFSGLHPDKSYSVQPMSDKYEYGRAKGTNGGTLSEKPRTFEFMQREQLLRLFDNATLNRIKNESGLTVRTPAEYMHSLFSSFFLLCGAWLLLYLILVLKKRKFDTAIFSMLIFLTGLCQITMFSINDPLNDKMLGAEMTFSFIAGVTLIGVLQLVDFVKFFKNEYYIGYDLPVEVVKWLFKPFRTKISRLTARMKDPTCGGFLKIIALLEVMLCLPFLLLDLLQLTRLDSAVERLMNRVPKGYGFLFLSLLLTLLLWTPLGREVGGMKVNLNLAGLVFQPSEIAKYLIIFFMAAFFFQKARLILSYSEENRVGFLGSKVKALGGIIVGLACLMALYLVLGDMGPGLVLGATFIFLYSLVKSKVALENVDPRNRFSRILTCDFAMLVYGVLTFLLAIYVGYRLGLMGIFCLLWFVAWVGFGLLQKKQLYETPILMNLVIAAFIFGGTLLGYVDKSAGERLQTRSEMCSNTWGRLGLEQDEEQKATVNTQVAEGLWGLASGGFTGQGLGKGNPNMIPAFHTDMVMESMGEQMGWIGLLFVILAYVFLLQRAVVVGYRSCHPFGFYLCAGIAIVTGVQFLIISLGSTGMIPLTGITVPFLSYGGTSMILNLVAFGIVLSISHHGAQETGEEAQLLEKDIQGYAYPVSILSWAYVLLLAFVLGVLLNYQVFQRDNTLVRPLFVVSANGEPMVQYNPRIALLVDKMHLGNIYDRNGILLATSDLEAAKKVDYSQYGVDMKAWEHAQKRHTQRYYPFGNHLFFMLGDYNTRTFFFYDEANPIGFLAEAQYLSELRGYDNVKYDANHHPVVLDSIVSSKYRANGYLGETRLVKRNIVLRDYSALLPYLKAGVNSKAVEKFNQETAPKIHNLYLTLDAKLQTLMQNELAEYVVKTPNLKGNNLLRISVVVLDAVNGDLLASANYPLPDQQFLRAQSDLGIHYCNDVNKSGDPEWESYTDRDLGLTFATPPGSTAKVMSALADFQKSGLDAKDHRMLIMSAERIEPGEAEPSGDVSLHDAIVKSSNCYFIHSVHSMDLYPQLSDIYQKVGVRMNGILPYSLNYGELPADKLSRWNDEVSKVRTQALASYQAYMEKSRRQKEYVKKMNRGDWQWAWGQGTIDATPLTMARVASAVINGGKMPQTRFLIQPGENPKAVDIVTQDCAAELASYMRDQARYNNRIHSTLVGGKTGTPERVLSYKYNAKRNSVSDVKKRNDGWYMCFVENCTVPGVSESHPVAVVIRMERIKGTSGYAMHLMNEVVLGILKQMGYMNE
ncbi:MAG: FtsW/RodA/SpoVE family cell cycle protein [Bacteroidales bacterium]|nr:FtsW/RodA/SpoVE family cell cycle protein [Bacteroidales bacterium]